MTIKSLEWATAEGASVEEPSAVMKLLGYVAGPADEAHFNWLFQKAFYDLDNLQSQITNLNEVISQITGSDPVSDYGSFTLGTISNDATVTSGGASFVAGTIV